LEPEYDIVASHFKGESNIVIAKVDATQHPEVSAKYQIRGYPTLKFFRNGNPSDFEGGRTADEIIQWLKKKTGPASLHVTSKEALDGFIAQVGSKIVAYVTEGAAANWLAVASSGRLDDFPLAHVTDSSLFGDHTANSAVIHKTGEDSLVHSGAFETDAIVSWAQSEGYPLVDELAQKIWQRSSSSGTPLLAVFIAEQNEDSTELVQTIAQKFKGSVLASYSTAATLAERWGTSGKVFPTGILVTWKGQEPKMTIYNEDGEPFSAKTGIDFVEQALKGEYKGYLKSEPLPESNDGPVKIIVGKNYDEIVLDSEKDVFVEFYAPWCGHCKNLAPIWDQLGEAFADVKTVTIAKMDATANHAPENLEIKGFPTLIFFPADNKAGVPFNGDRDLESLRQFVQQQASRPVEKEEL